MKTLRTLQDDDLVLYFYGEAQEPEEIRRRLAASADLRARYEALCQMLEIAGRGASVPQRPASYGAEVWARLAPRLAEAPAAGSDRDASRLLRFPSPSVPDRVRRLAWLAAAAVLLLAVGFLAGRLWAPPGGPRIVTAAAATPLPAAARERILARTVAAHLERSERLFTELANARADGPVDVSAERRWARDLLAANRLYRQSTRQGGRPRLTLLLDELEPFLLELSHGPDEIQADDLTEFRQRFEERSLRFKMRVVSARLAGPQTL
jgi:hypothetical protein